MGGSKASSAAVPEGQTYCLRWNNHKSNMIEILDALIKIETYVDCTIVVDDQVTFKAHRVVLAANSPYFQAILKDAPMDHCSILFPGVKAFEMRALLEYMYTGEVNVTQSQIPKIMRIAEELEVKGLFDMDDLKEKFNKISEEHSDRSNTNPYANSSAPEPPYSSVATSSTGLRPISTATSAQHNGIPKDYLDEDQTQHSYHQQHQSQNREQSRALEHHQTYSSSVISTSSHVSPTAAPSSSSSPPYSGYKTAYESLYSKSPNTIGQSSTSNIGRQGTTQSTCTAQSQAQSATSSAEHPQWPLSPSAAAAMLSSVYESAPDMNPLKRKKLSSLSSMLMNRDTPILRNVLAQANPADSSQTMPTLLSGAGKSNEKASVDNKSTNGSGGASNSQSSNLVYNGGSDYTADKKYQDEPHSPYTDRSFDDDSFDGKGNFTGNFGSNANQKPEWKRYKQYTRHDIMSAIQCVRDGMSALQASRKFGVPSRTLYDKVKKLGITTGRPMNRTMKRSPSNVDGTNSFSYSHAFGQNEPLLTSLHENAGRVGDVLESKEHQRTEHHHLNPTIPHSAAALLDHAFLQQALENRGGDIAGREALHAMALAAAAHAAANRLSVSPGPNGAAGRSPSPSYASSAAISYSRNTDRESLLQREKDQQSIYDNELDQEHNLEIDERDCTHDRDSDGDDRVEDLSVTRKSADINRSSSPYSQKTVQSKNTGVVIPSITNLSANNSGDGDNEEDVSESTTIAKREILSDDGRAD